MSIFFENNGKYFFHCVCGWEAIELNLDETAAPQTCRCPHCGISYRYVSEIRVEDGEPFLLPRLILLPHEYRLERLEKGGSKGE